MENRINQFASKATSEQDETYILNAADLAKAIENIKPGFEKIKALVEKDIFRLNKMEVENPEQATALRVMMSTQNNEKRLHEASTQLNENKGFYNSYLDLLEERGFKGIKNIDHSSMIQLGEKITQNIETRNRINELEISFDIDDTSAASTVRTKRKMKP